jgi:hypothetical protein
LLLGEEPNVISRSSWISLRQINRDRMTDFITGERDARQ